MNGMRKRIKLTKENIRYHLNIVIEEDRYIAIGCVGDILFVVFTERKDNIRLISARLATESERRLYYDQNIHY